MSAYTMTPASDLVEDFDVYPREQVDTVNISRLAEALRSKPELELRIVACKETKRIVDGFHSRRAYLRVFGPDVRVPVDFRPYDNEKDLYMDAMRLNAAHGKPITGSAMVHALLRGVDKGIDEMALAEIFGIRTERVIEIVKIRLGTLQPVSARGKSATKRSMKPYPIALKNSVKHLHGTNPVFTPQQAAAHDSGPGIPQWLMLKQVADYLEFDLMDYSNDQVVFQINRLRDLLAKPT